MDFKNSLQYRHGKLRDYEYNGKLVYDYEQHGILEKCLPKLLFKGNSILVTFLQLIDMRIIMMFKYIDRLKEFKNIAHYI